MKDLLVECLEALSPPVEGERPKPGKRLARAYLAIKLKEAIDNYQDPEHPVERVLAMHSGRNTLQQLKVINVWLKPGEKVVVK